MNILLVGRLERRILLIIFLIILSVVVLISSITDLTSKASPTAINTVNLPLIIIDAGHGGVDGGAVALDGTIEKNINLSIAKKLQEMLMSLGFDVIMTRAEDILISDESAKSIRQKKATDLKNRANIIKENPDSILISIHQNKFSQSQYSGVQVFYSENNELSKTLASLLQSTIVSSIQSENKREIKASGSEIFLLYTAKSPAVMVECGFMSNAKELSLLKSEDYQLKMAYSIMCGILEYYAEISI